MKKYTFINAMVLSAALSGNVLADLNDGLVAYYPFNGNAKDESGNGNDGTVNGATLTEDRFGKKESAYSFDGVDDYIQINDSDSLDMGYNDYTIVAWIKTSATSNNGRILSKGSSGCLTGYMMRMGGVNSSKAFLENAYNGLCKIRFGGNTTINDDQWHLVIGVVDRDLGGKIYIDANLDSSENKDTSSYNLSNDRNIKIGYNDVGNAYEPFKGVIDDIRIYNRALSESEIQQLYATTLEINISPKDSGTITKYPEKTSYSPNEEVTLTATPAKGYKFKQWQGDASGSDDTITIKMNGNQSVIAVFEKPKKQITSKATYDLRSKTLFLKGILVPFLDGFSREETGEKGIFNVQLQEKVKDAFELIPWSINLKGMFEGEDTGGYILYDHESRSVYIPCFKVATIAEIGDGIEGKATYYKDVTMKQWNESYPIFHIKDMTKADSCNL